MNFFDPDLWYRDPEGSRSVALIALYGEGPKVVNATSVNTYEVVSGRGLFEVWDETGDKRVFPVEVGSVVEIPAGHTYQDTGNKLFMLCTSVPAFDESAVTVVE